MLVVHVLICWGSINQVLDYFRFVYNCVDSVSECSAIVLTYIGQHFEICFRFIIRVGFGVGLEFGQGSVLGSVRLPLTLFWLHGTLPSTTQGSSDTGGEVVSRRAGGRL